MKGIKLYVMSNTKRYKGKKYNKIKKLKIFQSNSMIIQITDNKR